MKNFEQRLSRLEELNASIKNPEVPLEEALKIFEEGIQLARGMEKELDKIEGKIQILMNQSEVSEDKPETPVNKPELDLFSSFEK